MVRRFALLVAGACLVSAEPLRFRVTLDPAIAPKGASGRLIILMEPGNEPKERIKHGFMPGPAMIAAKEISFLAAGASADLDPDVIAYPEPFSKAAAGDYAVMALLDPNHSFARDRQDAGDYTSTVQVLRELQPASAGTVELRLTRVTPPASETKDTDTVKLVEYQSKLLTAFWGRPILLRAGIVLPKDWTTTADLLPAVYRNHGFGGNHLSAWQAGPQLVDQMATGERFRAVHVFLDGSFPSGHHVFADSVNNGPWGAALTTELIPELEKRFRLIPQPKGRFLTGHSSGGWTSLWLQVRYPDFFGGTWPTSPDAMDFHNFSGVDVTPESKENGFRDAAGAPRNLIRLQGKNIASMQEFLRMELVTGEYGGQLKSFDWVFSPRGPDGRPMALIDPATGEIDPVVAAHWQKYDIARIVRDNWATLGPKLMGKIRLVIGAEDNFRLNESAVLFCGWLREKGREDACEIVPGRDHMDLFGPYDTYPKGLRQRIDDEMRKQWEGSKN